MKISGKGNDLGSGIEHYAAESSFFRPRLLMPSAHVHRCFPACCRFHFNSDHFAGVILQHKIDFLAGDCPPVK